MGQVTIYLDRETEEKVNHIVKQSGLSKSKWITNLIRDKTTTVWPESIIQLAGTWKDIPTAETIRNEMSDDVKRESI